MLSSEVPKIGSTRVFIPDEDKKWIIEKAAEVLDSSILTEGKYCQLLESELAKYLGVKHVIVSNSGTGSLEIMLRASGVKGEIIVTPETFAATIYAILRAGCLPVFVDVGKDMALDPNEVRKRISPKTKGILTVHIAGHVSENTYELQEIAEKHGIPLFEDSAQAMGSRLSNKFAGTFGLASGYSLFPTKVMASAEGGFVVTSDSQIAAAASLYKDQGKKAGNLCTVQGYNWRMSEFQAIIGLTQLRRLEEFIERRSRIAKMYHLLLQEERFQDKVLEHYVSSYARPNWYKYVAFLKGIDRDRLKIDLKSKSISMSGEVYEVPCHTQPAFDELGYRHGDFPNAEEICNTHVCFPLMANLNDRQVEYFCDALRSLVKEA